MDHTKTILCKKYISKGNILKAIILVKEIISSLETDRTKEFKRRIIQLESELNILRNERGLGILDQKDVDLKINKITFLLLQLIEDIETPVKSDSSKAAKPTKKKKNLRLLILLIASFTIIIYLIIIRFQGNKNEQTLEFSSNYITVSEENKIKLEKSIAYLEERVENDAKTLNQSLGLWGASQLVLALTNNNDSIYFQNYYSLIEKSYNKSSNSWRQNNSNSDNYIHMATTGWALMGMDKLDYKISSETIETVLSTQFENGGWGMYPELCLGNEKYASTYTTCILLLALKNNLKRFPGYKNEISIALNKGKTWLIDNRNTGKITWKDYPALKEGKEIAGISPIVIHTLNKFGFKEFNVEWLNELDKNLIDLDEEDSNKIWYRSNNKQSREDSTNYFYFPWVIIALTDIYNSVDHQDKMVINDYLDKCIWNLNLYESSNINLEWFRGLLLISLKYLSHELSYSL